MARDKNEKTQYNANAQKEDPDLRDLLDEAMGRRHRKPGELGPAPSSAPERRYGLGRVVDLKKTLVSIDTSPFQIGRRRGDLLIEDDDTVSGSHCEIEIREDQTAWITDLTSTNGTFVNGKRVQTSMLRHFDTIRVGQTYLKFLALDEGEGGG